MTDSIDQVLETIEGLHADIMDALVRADAAAVERLVTDQAASIAKLPKAPLSEQHRDRVRNITGLLNQQQLLVDQASQVAGFILKQIYAGRAFSQRG